MASYQQWLFHELNNIHVLSKNSDWMRSVYAVKLFRPSVLKSILVCHNVVPWFKT